MLQVHSFIENLVVTANHFSTMLFPFHLNFMAVWEQMLHFLSYLKIQNLIL